ncbi:agmatinase [Candidatus Bathyarchaeota archaeon]|nr:agmatinase [Candidatus Bathyarchaeota archaeon]
MSNDYLNLLKPIPEAFFEKFMDINESDYILFSVPLDKTSSYRSGSRFAPHAIRKASQFMESYSSRTSLDWENLKLTDIGEIDTEQSIEQVLKNIKNIVLGIKRANKMPVMIGGEHTISLGALNALKPEAVVVFDAHLDLRDTLFEEKIGHATWLRRSHEKNNFEIVIIGARALSIEEINYANKTKINIIKAKDIHHKKLEDVYKLLDGILTGVKKVYLSIDMDALDPSEAPAVGNPYPEGLETNELLDIISYLTKYPICGVDLTEVSPYYDNGNTAIQASYILLETLYAIECSKNNKAIS